MANNEKIYVGKARKKSSQYGEFYKIWITPEGLEAMTRNVGNGGSVNLNMTEMRQEDRAGFTHTIYVDDYVPNGNRNSGGQSTRDDQRQPDREQGGGSRRSAPANASRRDDGGFGNRPPNMPPVDPADGPPGYDPEEDIPF